jgi:hypothetical protein
MATAIQKKQLTGATANPAEEEVGLAVGALVGIL